MLRFHKIKEITESCVHLCTCEKWPDGSSHITDGKWKTVRKYFGSDISSVSHWLYFLSQEGGGLGGGGKDLWG